jgi:hypothetical protein
MRRVLLAGLLGGLAAFAWSSLSHMVLPLGEAGVRTLPNEAAVLEGLRGSIPEAGLYLFPLMGDPSKATAEEQAQWAEKYRTGPAGVLIYHPVGGEFNFSRLLGVELLTNVLAALIAALILVRTTGSYLQRVLIVGALGLFAWFSISVSYWNWYGFPASFILAEGIDQFVGWLVAGLVIAKMTPVQQRA